MAEFKRIVNIAPFTRVGLNSTHIFSYLIDSEYYDQIRPGQLVRVPFGSREIYGVTTSFEMHRLKNEVVGYKRILKIEESAPVFSKQALELAEWLARYYVTSLGLVLKTMLPKPVKKAVSPDIVGYEQFDPDFVLTDHQRRAVTKICNSIGESAKFLLHGVTGSGKTEVYMQVMDRVIAKGQQVIVLVPEISLTPQAVERFSRRFGIDKIAILHSQLKHSERWWMWNEIRSGNRQIIIGPRSAVFAPVKNLGLIIMDEEHDSSYKQYEQNPKYHARTVAMKLSEIWGCPVVLGDATPTLESFFQISRIHPEGVLSLPHRIKADVGLPFVKIIDMQREIASGNYEIFSEALKDEILEKIENKQQIILFLNRRGSASVVLCQDCGNIQMCKFCSIALVWHQSLDRLLCHHCGKKYNLSSRCGECGGMRIKKIGMGTQKVEMEIDNFLHQQFDKASVPVVRRMDRDSVTSSEEGEKIYRDWVSGKVQILIGTQMISKGWDVSNVGLVGVVSADSGLHLPDFRSNERTFQLLTQVAGRTGRGSRPGLVLIQTMQPGNYAIQAAKKHSYSEFFQQEIVHRRKYHYPPFVSLVKLTTSSSDKNKAEAQADSVAQDLVLRKTFPIEILGPVPAFIQKIRGQWRYHIILKIAMKDKINIYDYLKNLPDSVDIDVDPANLL